MGIFIESVIIALDFGKEMRYYPTKARRRSETWKMVYERDHWYINRILYIPLTVDGGTYTPASSIFIRGEAKKT